MEVGISYIYIRLVHIMYNKYDLIIGDVVVTWLITNALNMLLLFYYR